MDNRELAQAVNLALARIGAIEHLLALLVAKQAQRDPSTLAALKSMAAGDTMRNEPDFSMLPPEMSQAEKAALIEGYVAVQKAVKNCSMELANRIASMIQNKGA